MKGQKSSHKVDQGLLPPLAQDPDAEAEAAALARKRAKRNDVKEIRTLRQLEKVDLDFDSPRLQKAMDDLGIDFTECQKKQISDFEIKGVDPEVADLRFKHYQARLMDTLSRIISVRRENKSEERKKAQRAKNAAREEHQQSSQQIQIVQQLPPQSVSPAPQGGATFLTGGGIPDYKKQNTLAPPALGGRKNSEAPPSNLNVLSPINTQGRIQFSPQKTMGHNSYFNENQAKRWAESRKSMVSARYEKEIAVRMEFEEKQKQYEKIFKKQQKDLKDRVLNNEVRTKEKDRLEEIGEMRRKKAVNEYLEAKHKGGKIAAAQRERQAAIDAKMQKKIQDIKDAMAIAERKRVQVRQWNTARDDEERRSVEPRLMEYNEKLHTSAEKQRNFLMERSAAIACKKDPTIEVHSFRQSQLDKDQQVYQDFQTEHKQLVKKVELRRKEAQQIVEASVAAKTENEEMQQHRHREEARKISKRNAELNAKSARLTKTLEAFKEKEKHKDMLINEERKLKNHDMIVIQTRQKRLDTKRKLNIMLKEKEAEETIASIKMQEKIVTDSRIGNLFKMSQDKINQAVDLDEWAQSGFKSHLTAQKRFSHVLSPNMQASSKKMHHKGDDLPIKKTA